MVLGGLWHGANWTFVVWGAYHGALLAVYRRYSRVWDGLPPLVAQALMFLLAVVGWTLFRSTSFGMAWTLFGKMFFPVGGAMVPRAELAAMALLIAGAWSMFGPNAWDLKYEWRWPGRLGLAAAFGAALAIIAGARVSPFLYFQF